MGTVTIRPHVRRKSSIPETGLQIGARGDRWEEEFIRNIDFSTMDNIEDWSYLFRNSKAYEFDLQDIDSSSATNMDYMFYGVNAGDLRLEGLTIGENTTANNLFNGSFNSIDFTGAIFYSLPQNMFNGASVNQGLQLATLDVSRLTSLEGMFANASLSSLDLTGFNTSTITNMRRMFADAEIPIVTGLNTLNYNNVVNAGAMFSGSIIPEINMSGINFSSLENASSMFYVSDIAQAKSVDLSNSTFPVLSDASSMFYSFTRDYTDPTRSIPLAVDLTNTSITSFSLNANYMFEYFCAPDGLDLSLLDGVKLLNARNMFYYAVLGNTDFSKLDFSEADSNTLAYYDGPFRYCITPIIHLKTNLPSAINDYQYFALTYENRADDVILEVTFSPINTTLRYLAYYGSESYNPVYLIKDSTIYANNLNHLIDAGFLRANVNVTFENSTLHLGNDASMSYMIYAYGGGILDMRDLVVDGVCSNSSNFMNYSCGLDEIYLPNTGIAFSGQLYYFISGASKYNETTQTYEYQSPVVHNLDKCDVSNIQSMSYVLYNCNGDYDFSSWDTSNLTYISSFAYNYYGGNLSLRNWDFTNVTYLDLVQSFHGGSIDFDGCIMPQDATPNNFYLMYAYSNATGSIYLPDTLYQPTSYTWNAFGGSESEVIDVYTNASSIEDQGWRFYHIYTEQEPYGYRIHLNSTHDDFLNAIGGD